MTPDTAERRSSTVLQMPNGQFANGNPGRRPGTKNKVSRETMESIHGMKDDAVRQLLQLVLSGDFKAITYVLDKILPKDRLVHLDDPSPSTIAGMLASAEISPEEGRNIATAFAKLQDVSELAEIRAKLDELEKLIGHGATD